MSDVKDLRERAKKLLEKAEQLENKKLIDVGKLVKKFRSSNFKDFSLENFKKEVANILD